MAIITRLPRGNPSAIIPVEEPEPPGDSDAPIYDAGNADHIPHIFDDWSTYSTEADIPTTNRVDGGESWIAGSTAHQTLSVTNNDPYFGVKNVRIDLTDTPAEGAAHQRGFVIHQSGPASGQFLNPTLAKASLVVEYAFRETGTSYAGKIFDWQPQGDPQQLWRFNFQYNFDGMGVRPNNHTDADPLCFAHYSNNGNTPRFAGLPPSANGYGFQWARTKNTPNYIGHWVQNRNWADGENGENGTFDYDSSLNGSNQQVSGHMQDGVWRRIIERMTLNEEGQSEPGYGRIEVWYQRALGPVVKIMEYYGDSGSLDAENGRLPGLVDCGLPDSHWLNHAGAGHWFDLTGQNDPGPGGFYTGGCTLWLGYFRMWSHSRLALP